MGHQNALLWHSARARCQEHGGDLVTVGSRKVERFLARFLGRNNRKTAAKMFTGLIYTNVNAEKPYLDYRRASLSASSADGLRWIATKEHVDNVDGAQARFPRADFVPYITGTAKGPNNIFHSCVALNWNPHSGRTKGLTWLYSSCTDTPLNFICEVKPPKRRCSRKSASSRYRRSIQDMNDDDSGENVGDDIHISSDFDDEEYDIDDDMEGEDFEEINGTDDVDDSQSDNVRGHDRGGNLARSLL